MSDPQRTGDDYLTTDLLRSVYARAARPRASQGAAGITDTQGWMSSHRLSLRALASAREEIARMLLCLPAGAREDVRGGMSVLHASVRGDGRIWTQDPEDIEKLVVLGIAVGLAEFCAERDRWARLPAGVPYFRVLITRFGVAAN